jgi:hypothetical protein
MTSERHRTWPVFLETDESRVKQSRPDMEPSDPRKRKARASPEPPDPKKAKSSTDTITSNRPDDPRRNPPKLTVPREANHGKIREVAASPSTAFGSGGSTPVSRQGEKRQGKPGGSP